jgi:hypothetical protein
VKKVVALALVLILSISLTYVYFKKEQQRLLGEVKILRDQGRILEEAVLSLRRDIERLKIEAKVSRLRELLFLKPSVYKEVSRQEVKSLLLKEFNEEHEDGGLEKTGKVLKRFGLIKPDYDLEKGLLSLYGEQIGAFYDPDKKAVFNVRGLNLGKGLSDAMLAHELTHMLQDQNFNIKSILDDKKRNDDEKLSHSSLIEGDATLLMQLYYLDSLSFSILWDAVSALFVEQKEFHEAPMVLQENIMFPYMKGLIFVTFIYQKNGWKGLNDCYHRLPASTEEILHPSKYLLNNDKPVKIVWPVLKMFKDGYDLIEENVLGEFNTGVLFKHFLGKYYSARAWEGWGGDEYQVYENKNNGKLSLIWLTLWDTLPDADEFLKAYNRLIQVKFPDQRLFRQSGDFFVYQTKNDWILMARARQSVLIVEAESLEMLNQVRISFEGFEDSKYNLGEQ